MEQGRQALIAEGVKQEDIQIEYSVDVRYLGQAYYLNVPWSSLKQSVQDFHTRHEQRYGHALDVELELVNIRVALSEGNNELGAADKSFLSRQDQAQSEQQDKTVSLVGVDGDVPVMARDSLVTGQRLSGPVLLTEKVSTTYIMPGWSAEVDGSGNIVLERHKR